MNAIQVGDKRFVPYLGAEEIHSRVELIAVRLRQELKTEEAPLFVAVLNGAFVFAADLLRAYGAPAEISFIKARSYEGTQSTGEICQVVGLVESVVGRTVVIVEDVIDSGLTIFSLKNQLLEQGAACVKVVTLMYKPDALRYPLHIDYAAFHIPNDFIIGYGMDYDGLGRNLADIYVVQE